VMRYLDYSTGEAGGASQLHDKGVQNAVAVIGRALIAQPRVRLARDLGGELVRGSSAVCD